jgi:RimJ/RimL family protein N-acetyltransferase
MAALQRAFEALSPNSRYLRFHVPMRRLPDGLARYLTDVDGVHHVALIAFDRARPDEWLGVARFVRNREAPETAEAAITLADRAQGRGIATRLLQALALEARATGIHTFTMLVLASNQRARNMLKRLGGAARGSSGPVITYDLTVAALDSHSRPAVAA